jgi:hypothetical protein
MGPGTGRSGGPRATPADTLRALAGDISEYLGPDALAAIARGLVEDAPGWEYADVLPRAVNRETGERSWAVPGMARDVAKGLWELMQGPYMDPGQNLSPEAVLSLPALAVPAGAALAPKGAIGMFAGRNAKTADLAALQRAEDMAAGGADNEAIRAATGWFKGPDEKWRFEIPDNAARMTGMSDFPASLVMEHDDLFRAYPELRDMPVESGRPPGGGRGAYDDGRKTITLAPDMDDPQARVTMLHELQHAIQSREGFAPGSNPTKALMGESRPHFMRLYNERLSAITTPGTLEDFAKQAGFDNLDEARPFYDEYVKSVEDMRRKGVPPHIDRMAQETAQDQTYKRTAGEVEARDVQSRADFAPDQRAATAPYTSQGIAPEDMIVLNRGGGVQASAEPKRYEYSMRYRKPGAATLPPGAVEYLPPSEGRPFGGAVYDKPLSPNDLRSFEMEPLDPAHPWNVRKAFDGWKDQFTQKFLDQGETYRVGKDIAVTPSTVPGQTWQLTMFGADGQPRGHVDLNDFDELARIVWQTENKAPP